MTYFIGARSQSLHNALYRMKTYGYLVGANLVGLNLVARAIASIIRITRIRADQIKAG